jgi:hypothetical protein
MLSASLANSLTTSRVVVKDALWPPAMSRAKIVGT